MQVEFVSWDDTNRGTIYTVEVSSFEIPRKDDAVSFDGVTHRVHHVKWRYEVDTMTTPPRPYLVGVRIYV
jgi:hypothetical protein